ncbi:protein CC2D2B homolog [Dipodomys spectabilis]|uniref:protein CC2D2B homolog n=1 Tax=Dipodomys spectabilis TaxID=105255 RepID=UPI001C53ECA8|nr:protein CC2D2B homolog [Dipodomys spectabilis]
MAARQPRGQVRELKSVPRIGAARNRHVSPVVGNTPLGWVHALVPIRTLEKQQDELESEETNSIVDKYLSKEGSQNITKILRGKVRGKLKSTKFNPQTEVLLDEGLSFFILSGEERSALSQSSEQRSVKDSYSKHFSLDDNLQNIAESEDEDFIEEVIFTDLLEVKAAEYEDNKKQIEKQQTNIFVPSTSPGNVLFQ